MGKSQIFRNNFSKSLGLGWARPGPKGNWAKIDPKMKSGQNQPKMRTYFLQGWTQPSHVGWNVQPKETNGWLLF
jgi:hypothetical protein